jgi:hypothetical protein
MSAADVNGDGSPDLISANFDDNTLTVLMNLSAPPTLKILPTNPGTALVSWSPLWPGYVLQQNTNLCTTSWSDISNPGGTNQLAISPVTGNKFFRLRHP